MTPARLLGQIRRRRCNPLQWTAIGLGFLFILSSLGVWGMYAFHPLHETVADQAAGIKKLKGDLNNRGNYIQKLERLLDLPEERTEEVVDKAIQLVNGPGPPARCDDGVQRYVGRIWEDWIELPSGTLADLHQQRRDKESDWKRKTDGATKDLITGALEDRLDSVDRNHQWAITVDSLKGADEDYNAGYIYIQVEGQTQWEDGQKITRGKNGWSFAANTPPTISWEAGQKIYILVELEGGYWGSLPDWNIIEQSGTGPLVLWRLGRVTNMPWHGECPDTKPPSPKNVSAGALATSSDGNKSVKLTIEPKTDLTDEVDKLTGND
jgi:hypothetical protein